MPIIGPGELWMIYLLSVAATSALFARKGRGGVSGFFVGLILGPIGVAIALILDPRVPQPAPPSPA